MWRPIDGIADWLRHNLSPRARLRAGILIVFGSIAWTVLALARSDEPPNVIAMSGIALVLTGVGIVISAEVLARNDEGSS